jgi:hypothetical protein
MLLNARSAPALVAAGDPDLTRCPLVRQVEHRRQPARIRALALVAALSELQIPRPHLATRRTNVLWACLKHARPTYNPVPNRCRGVRTAWVSRDR